MNISMNNTPFGFENYNFMSAAYHPTKMNYYDTQIYPLVVSTQIAIGCNYRGYEPIVPTMAITDIPQPVVPSQIDMYNNSSMPSSPESAVSSSSSCVSTLPPISVGLPICLSLTEKINERIAQVNKLPDSLLPEFHQCSKETYENGGLCMKKRPRRRQCEYNNDEEEQDYNDLRGVSAAELRRQVHIQSEQKRRAQIKDGFDVLRQHLPSCANKKMSKAALLHRAVQHLQHLKKNQTSILDELERLVQENEKLKIEQQKIFI